MWIFSGFLTEASKASILVMWTGDFMHSIVRRMRCEVNSAAALLASVDLPLRLWALVLIDLVDDVHQGGPENGKLPRRRVMALVGE